VTVSNTSRGPIFVLGGPVALPLLGAAPIVELGQLVVGDLPGAPPSFQERPQLDDVVQVFAAGGGSSVVCALIGARGVGKTQLAAAYARQQAAAGCSLVAWVSAGTTDGLVAGLDDVARAVGVADPDGDSAKSAVLLRRYLQTLEHPALLVIDNAMDADQVRRFVPVTGATRVIVTSTDHALAQLGTLVSISVFDRAQSLMYLRQRTGLNDDIDADRVAEELGDLPLALAQAASVIQLQRISYAEYLSRLRSMPVAKVLRRGAGDPYPKGVAEAILLSVQVAEDTDESGLAQRLLALIALLAPTGVPRTLVQQILCVDDGSADTSAVARVDELLARLVGFSLLVWGESGKSVIVHRLVARVIRERLQDSDGLATTIIAAAIGKLSMLRIAEEQAWDHREQGAALVAHTFAVWDNVLNSIGSDFFTAQQIAGCADMAGWAVRHLTVTADLSRATRIGEQVLADCERSLGCDHPNTLVSRYNLACSYESAGRLAEAIPLYETTLADCARVLGDDHPNTLISRNGLAGAYRAAGRLGEAIALYETTLADCARVLGDDDTNTLTTRNNVAGAYRAAGRITEAIQLYENTLAARERLLGAHHPDTLTTRNSLAGAYQAAGRLAEAIPLFESTLADCQRVLVPGHPNTLASRNDLAGAYRAAGRLAEAIPLYEATLADYERLLGAHHPNTLTTRNNVAGAYRAAGQLAEAIPLYEATLADYERVLGAHHPNTLTTRNNVAGAYKAAGQLAEAIQLYENTLADRERLLGAHHPDTLVSHINLADAYRAAGRLPEAIQLYERTLADCQLVLGTDDPITRTVRRKLRRPRGR
jgi:tetratricopeptide (TPR) repeat protein